MGLQPTSDTENQRRRHVGARHGVPLRRPPGVIFGGAAGDEESRTAFVIGARFLAALGMTVPREVFQQLARLSICVLAVLLVQ